MMMKNVISTSQGQQDLIKFKQTVVTLLFGILDGFEWQAGEWKDFLNPLSADIDLVDPSEIPFTVEKRMESIFHNQKKKFGQFIPSNCINFVEIKKTSNYNDVNQRHYMIVCNLLYLRETVVPNIKQMFQKKLNDDFDNELQTFLWNCNYLYDILVKSFIGRQGRIVQDHIREAIFYSGLDWSTLVAPTGNIVTDYRSKTVLLLYSPTFCLHTRLHQ
jgi:hypothetical protein